MLSIGTYNIPTGKKAWIEDVVVDETLREAEDLVNELVKFA